MNPTLREILSDDGFEDAQDALYPLSGDADDDVEAEAERLHRKAQAARKARDVAPSHLYGPISRRLR